MLESDWRTLLTAKQLLTDAGVDPSMVAKVVDRGHGAGIEPSDSKLPPGMTDNIARILEALEAEDSSST